MTVAGSRCPRSTTTARSGTSSRSRAATPDRLRIGDEVRLRVRAGFDEPIDRIFLRTTPDGEQAFTELRETAPGSACRWWEVTVRLEMPTTGYRFLIGTPDGPWWLNGSGLHRAAPTDREDFRLVAGFDPPGWLTDRVFYQVFPDRFANGDTSNDVQDGAWTYRGHATRRRSWDEPPGEGPGALVEFYGGDLAGLEGRLDHLADLGVNAIYLNPIFETRSNHGYDTIDYDRVAGAFRRRRGARVVAPGDGGARHPADARHRAEPHRRRAPVVPRAQADPEAETGRYFMFRERPDDYASWLGVRSLPKLDYRDTGLREAMYAGAGAVLRRWLRPPYSVDGWRIDVANMLGRLGPDQLGAEVARGIRAAVKEENPEAYLLGEHSFDATEQLAGDQWDGVMNYAGFQAPVLGWLKGVEYGGHGVGTILRADPRPTADMVETLDAYRAADAVGRRPVPVQPA